MYAKSSAPVIYRTDIPLNPLNAPDRRRIAALLAALRSHLARVPPLFHIVLWAASTRIACARACFASLIAAARRIVRGAGSQQTRIGLDVARRDESQRKALGSSHASREGHACGGHACCNARRRAIGVPGAACAGTSDDCTGSGLKFGPRQTKANSSCAPPRAARETFPCRRVFRRFRRATRHFHGSARRGLLGGPRRERFRQDDSAAHDLRRPWCRDRIHQAFWNRARRAAGTIQTTRRLDCAQSAVRSPAAADGFRGGAVRPLRERRAERRADGRGSRCRASGARAVRPREAGQIAHCASCRTARCGAYCLPARG